MAVARTNGTTFLALAALALAAGSALIGGCGSDGDDGPDPVPTQAPQTFKVEKIGDRLEIPLGTPGPGKFHFEARGFVDEFHPTGTQEYEYIYFWLYSGNNFYYKGRGEGFLYIPFEYAYTNYWCNFGKVKGRSNHPNAWFIENCYRNQDEPWQRDRWYSFDVEWDASHIWISVDGVERDRSRYGSNSLNLIAGMGWPPEGHPVNPGIVGMEFRNWRFTQP